MKGSKFIIVFVVFIWAFKLGSSAWTVIYFHWNKAMLVERYCVNKSNLTLHCDGKCYLAKQMAKTQDDLRMLDFRFRKNIQILHAVKEVWDHFKIKSDHALNFQNQVKSRPLLRDIHGILEEVIFDIFHPPSLLF